MHGCKRQKLGAAAVLFTIVHSLGCTSSTAPVAPQDAGSDAPPTDLDAASPDVLGQPCGADAGCPAPYECFWVLTAQGCASTAAFCAMPAGPSCDLPPTSCSCAGQTIHPCGPRSVPPQYLVEAGYIVALAPEPLAHAGPCVDDAGGE